MGEIERAGSGGLAPHRATTLSGEPVGYSNEPYTPSQAWDLLGDQMRTWAQQRAGRQIRDPHTRRGTVYWYCRVDPGPGVGNDRPATYHLVMFAKRGLAVSSGTTSAFTGEPGTTKWRHRRFDIPVDASQVRNDHRLTPGPPTTTATTARPGGRASDAGQGTYADLPAGVAARLANLPAPTQQFLLGPFTGSGRPANEGHVHARITDDGHELAETYWAYLFNASWLAFAQARRHLPSPPGSRRPAMTYAERVALLEPASWAVSAWVAPVDRAGKDLARR